MVDLGKTLGLTIVAEGVETAPQRDALIALGCDLVQGYFYGMPSTTDELLVALERARQGALGPTNQSDRS